MEGVAAACIALLEETASLAARIDDRMTVARIGEVRRRLRSNDFAVAVVGLGGQGKSSLINALIGDDLLPAADGLRTSHPVAVAGGPLCRVDVFVAERAEPTTVLPSDLAEFVTTAGNPDNDRLVTGVAVSHPAEILSGGLSLIDTPALGPGPGIASSTAKGSDAVVFVASAGAPLAESQLAQLRSLAAAVDRVVVALTMIDVTPRWAEIREQSQERLDQAGLGQLPIVALSPALAERARQAVVSGDLDLAAAAARRSGIDEMRNLLREALEQRNAGRQQGLLLELKEATRRMGSKLDQRLRQSEADPSSVEEIERLQARIQSLSTSASRWRIDLDFSTKRLAGDFEAELDRRLGELDRDFQARISEDGAGVLADLGPSLNDSLAGIWVEMQSYLDQWFLSTLAETTNELVDEGVDVTTGALAMPQEMIDAVDQSSEAARERSGTTLGEKALAAYPGLIAASLPSSIATLGLGAVGVGVTAALAPVLVGAGVVTGGVMVAVRHRQVSQVASERHAQEVLRSTLAQARRTLLRQSSQELASIRRSLDHEISERLALRRAEVEQSLRRAREAARRDVAAQRREGGDLSKLGTQLRALVAEVDKQLQAESTTTPAIP